MPDRVYKLRCTFLCLFVCLCHHIIPGFPAEDSSNNIFEFFVVEILKFSLKKILLGLLSAHFKMLVGFLNALYLGSKKTLRSILKNVLRPQTW